MPYGAICMRRIVLLVSVVLLVVVPLPAPVHADESLRSPQYILAAQVDYDADSLTVKEQVRYPNHTGQELPNVVFEVTPAFYKAIDIRGVQVDGQAVDVKLDGTVLDIPLPHRLAPNEQVSVSIDFFLNVPKQGGRLSAASGVIALGNWFPILSVYRTARLTDNGQPLGWSKHQYVDIGDAFFTEVASYDVTVDVNKPVAVAYPGTLVSHEGNSWHIRADNVRDFALAIAEGYQSTSREVDGTTISAYYIPGHEKTAEEYVDAAAKMVTWMNRAVLHYPYPRLTLAEMYGPEGQIIGQEYPGLIFVDQGVSRMSGGEDSYLAYLVNHEVAHMWFYGVIGDDQLYEPWFDEGMASWLSLAYYRANSPGLFDRLWKERETDNLQTALDRLGTRPLNTGIYDYTDEGHYSLIVYRRAALFIEELSQTIGFDKFMSALGRYTSVFEFKIATTTSLLDFMQEQTSTSLNPLYARYFSFPRYAAGEPLSPRLQVPEKADQGKLDVGLSPQTDARSQVFLDDLPLPHQDRTGGLEIDLSAVVPGDYVFTVLLSGTGAAKKDLVSRLSVSASPSAAPAAGTPAGADGADRPTSALPIPLPLFLLLDVVILAALGAGVFLVVRGKRK